MSCHALPAALVLLAAPLVAQDTQADRWTAAVEAFERFTVLDSTVGGSLVLVRDGEILRAHHHGHRDLARRLPVDASTIWHWGSITKTLTAVAVMRHAAAQGMALLDAPITRFVPEIARIHSPFGNTDAITPRMLLSHSSGLQSGTWPWTRGEPWEPFEPTEWAQLVAMMPYMSLQFAPGTRYNYSNPGIVYLARLLEQAQHDPWEAIVQKQLFMPLGVDSSYFNHTPPHLLDARSVNYRIGREGVTPSPRDFHTGITTPNGGWNAPVGDIASWLAFLAGSPDGSRQARYDQVLPRAVLTSMWEPVVRVSETEQMGLSFFLREVDGQRLVGHTGTQANFRSFFWLNPATRTAVIGVVNTSGAGGNQAGPRFAAMMGEAMKVIIRRS